MDDGVEFTWDQAKSDACYKARGFDFEYVARVFLGDYSERIDNRRDYGEVRRQVIGSIDDRLYMAVYTQRGQTKRIISARRARQKELDQWWK